MISKEGVNGNPTVFGTREVFDSWAGEPPGDPEGFVGLQTAGKAVVVAFHDPESTYVFASGQGAVFVQWIAAPSRAAVNDHLKKLPATGWKRVTGTYASDGGEHVLFDSSMPGDDYNEELAGPLQTIELAKGTYALEELGIWKPDDDTELVLARLVPA